jgi:hypothetical protein
VPYGEVWMGYNLLDVLRQYKTFGFFRFGLAQGGILSTQNLCKKTKYQPIPDLLR